MLLSVKSVKSAYLLNTSGRPDRFSEDTRIKQEVLMKPVRSLPQVIEMLQISVQFFFLRQPAREKYKKRQGPVKKFRVYRHGSFLIN